MTIIGPARLADALQWRGPDYAAAFQDYHDGLHGFVGEVRQRPATQGM